MLLDADVGDEGGDRHVRGHVPGQTTKQQIELLRITALAVNRVDVRAPDLVQVVAGGFARCPLIKITSRRPSASSDFFGQGLHRQARIRGLSRLALKQSAQGHPAGADTGLEEAHRSHPQAREPHPAAMASLIIGRRSGAGQDELAAFLPIVDGVADVVPDRWLDLPLVDQARRSSVKNDVRRHLHRLAGVSVDVQPHLARGQLTRGLSLAAGLRALDQDRAC